MPEQDAGAVSGHEWLIDCRMRYRRSERRFVCLDCGGGFTLAEFCETPRYRTKEPIGVIAMLVMTLGGAVWRDGHIEVVLARAA